MKPLDAAARVDGTSRPGAKHHGCFHFVLDTVHDPYAAAALRAYADACEKELPALAKDLRELADKVRG